VANEKKEEPTVVAIKEIPVKGNHDITQSLLQEVNVLRKLKHRNIVTFIDSKMNDE
jgi:serine/threonine protein kinase